MKKLILAKGTEFEQNDGDLVLIDTNFRAGKPIMLNSSDLDAAFMNAQAEALSKIGLDDSLNIFIQEDEPTKKVGLWFQKETSQVDRLLADKDFYQFMEMEVDKYTKAYPFYEYYTSSFNSMISYRGKLYQLGIGARNSSYTKFVYNDDSNTWTQLVRDTSVNENGGLFTYEYKNAFIYNDEVYFTTNRNTPKRLDVYKFNTEANRLDIVYQYENDVFNDYDEQNMHITGTPYIYMFEYYGKYMKVNFITGEYEIMPGTLPQGLCRNSRLFPIGDKIYWFNGSPATMQYIDVTSGKVFDTGIEVPYAVPKNVSTGTTKCIPYQILDNYIYILANKEGVPGIWYVNVETEEVSEFIPCDINLDGASAIHKNKLWGFSQDGQIRVFPLETKPFEGTCVILIPSTIAQKGLHATEIFNCLNFEPGYSVLYSFYNAYLMQNKEVQKVPTYYGNGTEWIRIN